MCQCIAVFIFFLDIFPLIFIIFWFCLPEGGNKQTVKMSLKRTHSSSIYVCGAKLKCCNSSTEHPTVKKDRTFGLPDVPDVVLHLC